MTDDAHLTTEAIAAYWRLKQQLNKKAPIDTPAIYALMRSIAPLFDDRNWPDLSMFDKLFIERREGDAP